MPISDFSITPFGFVVKVNEHNIYARFDALFTVSHRAAYDRDRTVKGRIAE